jgi:hypothetical protein
MNYVLIPLALGAVLAMLISDQAPPVRELVKYHDDASSVTCFRAAYKDGISCIPDYMLKVSAVKP